MGQLLVNIILVLISIGLLVCFFIALGSCTPLIFLALALINGNNK